MNSTNFFDLISITGYAVEVFGVLIILVGMGRAVIRNSFQYFRSSESDIYYRFRREMGRAMLIGLELLVAGDIIRTVVVIDSLSDVASLGLVVIIRTVLVFTIHLEVEGHWPWQASRALEQGAEAH
jgi:uncharacterized membrane protein